MKTTRLSIWLAAIRDFIIAKMNNPLVLIRFLLVSGSAVILNLILLYLLVNFFMLNTPLGENIANVASMEIAVIYNFFMSRWITWGDRHKEKGVHLLLQLLKFHVTIGITIIFRIILFFLLQLAGLHYMLNAAIGIALAALFNFVVYDALIFKSKEA